MTLPVNCGKRRMRLQERASCAMVCGAGRKAVAQEVDCHPPHSLWGGSGTKIERYPSHLFRVKEGANIGRYPSRLLGDSGTIIEYYPSQEAFGVKSGAEIECDSSHSFGVKETV